MPIALAALLGAALLVSCQSVAPPVDDPGILALLPPKASSYFFVNVERNRGLVRAFVERAGVDSAALDPVIERTRYLYGAFAAGGAAVAASSGTVGRRSASPLFYVIGTGSYPGFLFGAGLSRSGEWRKLTMSVAGRSRDYWQQKAGRLEVALSLKGQLLASNGDIRTLFSREQRGLLALPAVPPEITREFAFHAALFYAPSPPESAISGGGAALSLPGAGSLPIGNLLVLVDRVAAAENAGQPRRTGAAAASEDRNARFRIELSFEARSERDARTLSVVTKLAAVAMLSSVGEQAARTMRTLDVAVSGRLLRATGISVTAGELSELVFQFVGSSGIK